MIDENDNNGYFTFMRGSTSSANSFNPAVLASPTTTQAGTYSAQLQALNYSFLNVDTYMNKPLFERIAERNNNRYANTVTNGVGVFSPLMTGMRNAGYWIKPYVTFEDVPLKNGPKVSNINYGTLIGYDTPIETTKNGWDKVITSYIGYNGSNMSYAGNNAFQNGGLLGATLTFYRDNFFNATTVSAGANIGEASTMFGHESYTSLLATLANKLGYNFEFKDGRFIIQPSMVLAYNFIKTFDYTNAAGVSINSDPMSAIHIAPTLKFIANTKKGWQPYLSAGMVWNIMAHSETRVGGFKTPEMYIKPYVQYGVGVQKRFADSFLGFLQTMVYNGGRNGVMLTGGLRWSVGK
jgi:outer membrane autotransporter protein